MGRNSGFDRDYDADLDDMISDDLVDEANEILDNIDKTRGSTEPAETEHSNKVVPLRRK